MEKVTGSAIYGGDVQLPGLLSGFILRSPHAHARITSIDTSEAEATMYYEAPDREIKKRDLHPDDIAGLCTVYPTDVPETVYTDELDEGGCCATTPAGNAPAKHHWLLGFALMLFWRSRNPRRAKTPRSPARLG